MWCNLEFTLRDKCCLLHEPLKVLLWAKCIPPDLLLLEQQFPEGPAHSLEFEDSNKWVEVLFQPVKTDFFEEILGKEAIKSGRCCITLYKQVEMGCQKWPESGFRRHSVHRPTAQCDLLAVGRAFLYAQLYLKLSSPSPNIPPHKSVPKLEMSTWLALEDLPKCTCVWGRKRALACVCWSCCIPGGWAVYKGYLPSVSGGPHGIGPSDINSSRT